MNKNTFWILNNDQLLQSDANLKLNLVKVSKSTKLVQLECFDSGHLQIRNTNNSEQNKYILLSFEYKFEVFRDKNKFFPEQCSDIEIISIRITKENTQKFIEFEGEHQELLKLSLFLSKKINQLGFHQYFKVDKRIGKGNFASVYLAERLCDGLQMAVKAFHKKTIFSEQNGKEALINEIQIMRQLDHPNLMKLYEVYETQNSIYMCLELLQGGQLYDQLKIKRSFDQNQIFSIMQGLVRGIRHMHKNGIMHRDLKLENILFKEQDNFDSVVIADFGLATEVKKKPYIYTKCGTPGFVAPEIINLKQNSSQYEYQCDLYSLGIILYILLTGQPAFKGRNYDAVVRKNSLAVIDFSNSKLRQISDVQLNFLKQLLTTDPNKRINSYDAQNHPYFYQEFDEQFAQMSTDDDPHLDEMIQRINVKYIKISKNNYETFIDQENELLKTDELRDEQNLINDQLMKLQMRSPVITGRTLTVSYSPSKRGHLLSDELIFSPSK